MNKYFKSRFSEGTTESTNKSKVNIEFFQLLKNFIKRNPGKLVLNIPETIVMNCPGLDTSLLYTDTDSCIYMQENITSE